MDEIICSTSAKNLLIQLNRPQKRNALNLSLVDKLSLAINEAQNDSKINKIFITGSGSCFCAGGDLKELISLVTDKDINIEKLIYGRFQQLTRTIRHSNKPVIALLNGVAIGAGADLALACNLRIAKKSSGLWWNWRSLNLLPGMGGGFFLYEKLGWAVASRILIDAKYLDADTAHNIGLIDYIVEEWELEKIEFKQSSYPCLQKNLSTLARLQATLLRTPSFIAAAQKILTRSKR